MLTSSYDWPAGSIEDAQGGWDGRLCLFMSRQVAHDMCASDAGEGAYGCVVVWVVGGPFDVR